MKLSCPFKLSISWSSVWFAPKCVLFRPSGGTFPEFPTNVKHVSEGLELLGSLNWETTEHFDQFLFFILTKAVATQDSIAILEDPHVELHLLCSRLGSCKIVHLLCTVPFSVLCSFLEQFDLNLKSRIIQCSLPCDSWYQASLPLCLGGHPTITVACILYTNL